MIDVIIAAIIGVFAGSFITILVMSLCYAARKGDGDGQG